MTTATKDLPWLCRQLKAPTMLAGVERLDHLTNKGYHWLHRMLLRGAFFTGSSPARAVVSELLLSLIAEKAPGRCLRLTMCLR